MTATPPPIKAVVYTRFSPRRKADKSKSCETQLSYCEQYAHDNNMEIVQVFKDRAISGKEEDRPLLWSAMDALSPNGVLLVYKHDRLARNVYLSECIRRQVEKVGAKIIAVEGDIEGDGPEQVMVRQVLAVMAEYERKIGAIRTKHAMLHHQRTGRLMSRYPPYGTMIDPEDPSRIISQPDEQPAVDMILNLHKRELTLHEIVVYMQRELKHLVRGKNWTQRIIARVIQRAG